MVTEVQKTRSGQGARIIITESDDERTRRRNETLEDALMAAGIAGVTPNEVTADPAPTD